MTFALTDGRRDPPGHDWLRIGMDDPSEDLLFELFQDIARGDEDFFILERLDDRLENPQGGAA